MKIAIIGGGPAGLYAAILLKKQRPKAEITVYERNRADDTFGFGVVFSDATLDNFEKYDPPSYRRITQEFAYWDDIAVHFRGTVHRVGGNGFCGCSRRTLLLILQERARELGVTLLFETDIDDEAPLCRRRSGRAGRRHQQPLPRKIYRPFPARGRPALQQVRLDGLDPAARRLHLHFPGDGVGPVHRPCLSVRSRAARPGSSRPIPRLPARRPRRPERAAIRRPDGGDFRLVPRRPSAADQPLDVAQFPDDPQQALGQGQHGAARRRQGDRAFLDRLRHQACDGRCHRAGRRDGAGADGRGRACSTTSTAAARKSRRPSTPPTCRWSGSSMSTASGISIPCSSRSAS